MNDTSCLAKGTFAATAIGRSRESLGTTPLVRTFHPRVPENVGGGRGGPSVAGGGSVRAEAWWGEPGAVERASSQSEAQTPTATAAQIASLRPRDRLGGTGAGSVSTGSMWRRV